MREPGHSSFLAAAIVLCSLAGRVSASYCYPDYCQNLTQLVPIAGFQCVLTRVQKGEDCSKLKYMAEKPSKWDNAGVFTLYAYVTNIGDGKVTAFNLSVSDVNFHRLTTRYQDIVDADQSACRHVELYGNASHPVPKDFYVSCPFASAAYEGTPYRLEYLATGSNYVYCRKYIFYVPEHDFIEDGVQTERFTPFVYVDVSIESDVIHTTAPVVVQRDNVTEYKMWLVNNDTQLTISTVVLSANKDRGHVRYNVSALTNGVYYIKVAALHPECDEHGCANSTSPYIYIIITYSHRTRVSSTVDYDNQLNMDTTGNPVHVIPRV